MGNALWGMDTVLARDPPSHQGQLWQVFSKSINPWWNYCKDKPNFEQKDRRPRLGAKPFEVWTQFLYPTHRLIKIHIQAKFFRNSSIRSEERVHRQDYAGRTDGQSDSYIAPTTTSDGDIIIEII